MRFNPVCRSLETFCAGRYSVTRSMPYILEIGDPVCSKGSAARALADRFNRSILVCAGDAPNDVTMLDAADFAFLPADCDETLRDTRYIKAAPSSSGTIADTIKQLKKFL